MRIAHNYIVRENLTASLILKTLRKFTCFSRFQKKADWSFNPPNSIYECFKLRKLKIEEICRIFGKLYGISYQTQTPEEMINSPLLSVWLIKTLKCKS